MDFVQNIEIENLFGKKFKFERGDWTLPPICDVFEEESYKIESLQNLKLLLNETKSLLNDKGNAWQRHTANINKFGQVLDTIKEIAAPEILTQAWGKFYEILSSYELINLCSYSTFCSFHLCEAPGAFISALNYYICSKHPTLSWKWYANSLNPYFEGHNIKNVVVDDRLLSQTLMKWHFGSNNTGDIMDPAYIYDINDFLKKKGPVHLITADGSFSCLDDPGEQELLVAKLHLKEVVIALHNLASSGSFVLKKFTFFEDITVCTIFLLTCCFEEVHVFKPATSKSGNSEVYVICLQYFGVEKCLPYLQKLNLLFDMNETTALFPYKSLPSSF